MDNANAKELLIHYGFWSETEPDISGQLIKAYDKVQAADAGNRILTAKICAHLRETTGKSVAEIADWLRAECPKWEKSWESLCRYIRAGDLLLKWPVLDDVGNIDKLCVLRRIPKKLQPEIFGSGLLPDGRLFRELDRETLTLAVNELRGQKPKPDVIPSVKARREIDRFVEAMHQLTAELAQLERFPRVQAQLQQWQAQLKTLLDEELNPVAKAPLNGSAALQPRGQYFVR